MTSAAVPTPLADLHVLEAGPEHAEPVREVVVAAFSARRVVDPPSTATRETVRSVAEVLSAYGGLLALVDGVPAGAMLFDQSRAGTLRLRRVATHPAYARRGVASAMVGCAEEVAARRRLDTLRLGARRELPETVRFWLRRGYHVVGGDDPHLELAKPVQVGLTTATPEATYQVGRRLAALLRAGDLVLLSGDLGAGKTTLARGVGAGLGVRGEVTSPTFVIARVHPARSAVGPALVHVDAYRLSGIAELDDLDLDASLDESVTVVEWGTGIAEDLAGDRLEVTLRRPRGDPRAAGGAADADAGDDDNADAAEPRSLVVTPVGSRWVDVPVRSTLDAGSLP